MTIAIKNILNMMLWMLCVDVIFNILIAMIYEQMFKNAIDVVCDL
jgi:hypothetical protein